MKNFTIAYLFVIAILLVTCRANPMSETARTTQGKEQLHLRTLADEDIVSINYFAFVASNALTSLEDDKAIQELEIKKFVKLNSGEWEFDDKEYEDLMSEIEFIKKNRDDCLAIP
jgi:hypothetical protein